MKIEVVRATALRRAGRLDTAYFLAPPAGAGERVKRLRAAGVRFVKLGATDGLRARVWAPQRFKRAYAASAEEKVPYLRPHDVFNYLPEPADWLSVERTGKVEQYRLRRGMILQTCSGRNLGPAVMADEWLARFVLSHDMIRIEIDDEDQRLYVLAYLKSPLGQELLRRDMTGSVIDHLTDRHVAEQEIPFPAETIVAGVAAKMRRAFNLRERARRELNDLLEKFAANLPALKRAKPLAEGWTVRATKLVSRIDSAFYDPLVATARRQLQKLGSVAVRDVARVVMLGRYKRLYTNAEHGHPIISGEQLLQSQPVHLQHISAESFDDVAAFELQAGWIAYPSDGRAEESLGAPVIITNDKAGWLASNMVGRILPAKNTDVGWLYLALKSMHAQIQFKATASGSVIDHTYPPDMEGVLLPKIECDGNAVLRAWRMLGEAQVIENEAVQELDDVLTTSAAN